VANDAQARGAASRQELFRQILGFASLPPQHTAMIDLLLKLDGEGADDGEEAAPVRVAEKQQRGSERDSRHSRNARLDHDDVIDDAQVELSDLRELNDTLAAALGSCRFCWGGDAGCELCCGHGASGWAAPDPTLFQELVVPAVQRLRAPARRHRPAPHVEKPRRKNSTINNSSEE
jgi:hypothetical protein